MILDTERIFPRIVFGTAVLFAALTPFSIRAQVSTADLQGVITDPSDSAIAGVHIRIENPEIGLVRETTSRETGEYSFISLPPARYKIRVEAKGFRTAVMQDVPLTVGQKAYLPVRLQISVLAEALDILVSNTTIETTRSSLATTIDQRAIEDLPINGRSYIQFTLLDSAATRDNQPILAPAPTSGLNINGQRSRANFVSIDGADVMDNSVNGVRATVSQEAVQEFQILKSGYTPEHGRASSAVINIVSKQGTNQWRGNVFGYLRSRKVSATNAFAGESDPGDTRTQTGATLGGPIKKDQTFGFISFETAQANSINFSEIGRDNFELKRVPFKLPGGVQTSALLTSQQEEYLQRVEPAVAIPYALLATAGADVAIRGNTPGGPITFGLVPNPLPASFRGLATEVGNYKTTETTYFYSARLDHKFSSDQNLFGRFSVSPSDLTGLQSNSQNQVTALNAFSRTSNSSTRDLAIASQLTSQISPTWLSEFRFQFARRGASLTPNSSQVAVEIPGVASIGQQQFAPLFRTEKRWQVADNITYIRRSHTLKMGTDFNILPVKAIFPINQSGIYFFPAALAVDDPIITAVMGSSLTSAWKLSDAPAFSAAQAYGFGLPDSFVQQFGGFENAKARLKNTTLGAFIQDSWKIASNFTLNYGLRYDVEFTPRFLAGNQLSEIGQDLLGVTQGIPRDRNNWAPRAGFAWDPAGNGKTVIRGSYGLFYGHPLLAIAFLSNVVDGTKSPYLLAPHKVGADDLFQGRAFTGLLGQAVANPALGYDGAAQRFDPLSPVFSNQNSALTLSPLLAQTFPVARKFQYDSALQGTFGIERQLATSMTLGVDYTYAHGAHLLRPRNINQGNYDLIVAYERASAICPGVPEVSANGCATSIYGGGAGPLAGLWDALGGKSATSLAPLGQLIFNQFRATGPNYAWANSVSGGSFSKPVMDSLVRNFGLPHAPNNAFVPVFNVKQYESSGSSVYHAVTATLNKRFSRHYQMLGSWTWSHAIDDSTDLLSLQEPQDNTNTRLERGNSNFDQRHRFVVSGIFDSPTRFSNLPAIRGLLRGWTVAPVIEVSSGRPYNLLTFRDSTLINSSETARPDVVPLGTAGSFPSPDGIVALALPRLGSVGNLGRNVYRTPSFASVDIRLTRHVSIGEARIIDLSVDAFNLFNRVNVREVDNSFTQGGRPVAAFGPRQIQFSLKFFF
ncbi:MAG: TonB-dependent receptor [Acidobacteria bacterium]|nr:TonB-dependent receptor [Acidobacteriota bacterium]MCI0722005.1 TonB-dependent receptor [Acidobacteriota bacterium]